jgi:PTH1 family peptidyl-tRNA hydrolase
VGLGNPGVGYAATRHNAGFVLADRLAEHWGLPGFRRVGPARVTHGEVLRQIVLLVKPHTYMNRSGAAMGPLLDEPDFSPARDLLVLVDDAALPLGGFRLRATGSAGGHNGLKSIEAALGTRDYARLRIGVGPVPDGLDDLADYVLDGFEDAELRTLDACWPTMIEAVECWITDGIELAMTRFNRPPAKPLEDT